MFGSASGMAQSRHQPGVPPINPTPGIRAQVPHQFLSPQVWLVVACEHAWQIVFSLCCLKRH